MKLGYFVSFTHRPSVPLFKVGRTPGTVKMMDSHGTFLGVHARTEHRGGTEQYPNGSLVHARNERLSSLVALRLLYEAYLLSGYAVVLHQLPFDFAVRIPLSGLVGSEVGEYELRTFLCVILPIILCNLGGTVGSLVVHMIRVLLGIYEPQI